MRRDYDEVKSEDVEMDNQVMSMEYEDMEYGEGMEAQADYMPVMYYPEYEQESMMVDCPFMYGDQMGESEELVVPDMYRQYGGMPYYHRPHPYPYPHYHHYPMPGHIPYPYPYYMYYFTPYMYPYHQHYDNYDYDYDEYGNY